MNILYIVPSFKKSGPINVCLSLVKNLSVNNTVSVLAFKGGEAIEEFSLYCKAVKVIEPWSIVSIYLFINRQKFDIIHSHCLIPDFLLSFFSSIIQNRKFISVSTIHNYIDIDYVLSKGRILGTIMGWVNRFSLKRIDSVVSCSDSVAEYCFLNYKIESTSISNGVASINHSHNICNKKNEGIDFFYLGVLNERKNVDFLINAFHLYKSEYNNSDRLHIIGGGDKFHIIKNKNACDYLFFYGPRENPYDIIATLDVYVSASKAEGMPLALLESLSCGKPYICSDIPPHREVDSIIGCGIICGFDEFSYVNAFRGFGSWDLSMVVDKIKIKFNEKYSDIAMAEKYMNKYSGLINEK